MKKLCVVVTVICCVVANLFLYQSLDWGPYGPCPGFHNIDGTDNYPPNCLGSDLYQFNNRVYNRLISESHPENITLNNIEDVLFSLTENVLPGLIVGLLIGKLITHKMKPKVV